MCHRLKGTRAYLCGPMDFEPDGGVRWRKLIGNWLRFRGVAVLDPTDKPTNVGKESPDFRDVINKQKEDGDWESIAETMRVIRRVDLRMVDIVDFLIVHLDMRIPACGTYEELFMANSQKKPVILHCEQGKSKVPNWIFGTLPHNTIFSTWTQVHQYLARVDNSKSFKVDNRWMWFDYKKMNKAA